LPAATVTAGTQTVTFAQQDYLVATAIAGKTTQTATFGIGSFPCGVPSVTFGQALPSTYVKGPCPDPTQSCGTITWLQPNDAGAVGGPACSVLGPVDGTQLPSPAPSKCRHQQIIIQGRAASFTTSGNTDCGGVATLVVNASGDGGTYSVTVTGSNGFSSSTVLTSTVSLAASVTYTNTVTSTTTYVANVGFGDGCVQSFTRTVTATPLGTFSVTASTPDCSGVVNYTATVNGATTYVFTDDRATTTSTTSPGTATRTYTPTTTAQTHTMTVVASNAASCAATGTTTVTVPPAVSVSLAAAGGGTCAAEASSTVTLTATPSGGNGTYTLTWSVGGTATQTNTVTTGGTAVLIYPPNPDASPHVVQVAVSSDNCSGASQSKTISQCVNTSIT
jgi:hypothetical protein